MVKIINNDIQRFKKSKRKERKSSYFNYNKNSAGSKLIAKRKRKSKNLIIKVYKF